MSLPRVAASLALACLGLGCDGGDARDAWLRALFIAQDRELAAERPTLVAGKYATMAASRYDYLRGSAIVFYGDAARYAEPALAHSAGAELVPLAGDLHLENLGAVPDGTSTIFDFTDFDATVRGPYDWDLRRAALGVAALDGVRKGHAAAGDPAAIAASVGAFLDGYTRALGEDARGPLPRAEIGAIAAAHLDDADGRLRDREELNRYTTLVDGHRRILRSAELVDVASPWDRGLDEAIAAWVATRRGGALPGDALVVKDVARRLSAGVASLAAHRFYVLLEGAPGEDDDLLLELKEARDPPEPAGLLDRGAIVDGPVAGPLPYDNAARILLGASRLLSSPTAEAELGRTSWNGVPIVVRSATRGRRNLDVADLVVELDRGKIDDAALAALATDVGRLLGRAHARAGVAAIIAPTVGADYRAAAIARASDDAARLADDHRRFVALLAAHGPLLGAP